MSPLQLLLLLTVVVTTLAASLTAPETDCLNSYGRPVATAASCDVALNNLQRFMLPYYSREFIKVGSSRTSDIQLWKAFADDSPGHPPGEPRCGITFVWDPYYKKSLQPHPVSPNAWDTLSPNELQNAAQRIRDQCVAGIPPQYGIEHIVPHQWIKVQFESFALDLGSGNWTMLTANGSEITVNGPIVNPATPSASSASHVLETGPESYSVESS